MRRLFLACLVFGFALTGLAADSKPISVRVDQEFKITLPYNATTGYQWQLARPLDENLLMLTGSEYKRPNSGLMGAGGKQVWTFRALAAGKAQVELEYLRPWEKGTAPARTTNFVVVIEKKKTAGER